MAAMTEGTMIPDAARASATAGGRPVWLGMKRGLAHRCPACGEGRLYRSYLKIDDACEACAHPLGEYRADDGPAYLTILLIGHLVVAPLLLFPFIWQWPAQFVLPLTLIPVAALVLLLLPRIKGAFLGVLWAVKADRGEGLGARDE